jgi:hypothetical protein
MYKASVSVRCPWGVKETCSEAQNETVPRNKTMRNERSEWRVKWVFFFISHETSEFLNATFLFLLFHYNITLFFPAGKGMQNGVSRKMVTLRSEE